MKSYCLMLCILSIERTIAISANDTVEHMDFVEPPAVSPVIEEVMPLAEEAVVIPTSEISQHVCYRNFDRPESSTAPLPPYPVIYQDISALVASSSAYFQMRIRPVGDTFYYSWLDGGYTTSADIFESGITETAQDIRYNGNQIMASNYYYIRIRQDENDIILSPYTIRSGYTITGIWGPELDTKIALNGIPVSGLTVCFMSDHFSKNNPTVANTASLHSIAIGENTVLVDYQRYLSGRFTAKCQFENNGTEEVRLFRENVVNMSVFLTDVVPSTSIFSLYPVWNKNNGFQRICVADVMGVSNFYLTSFATNALIENSGTQIFMAPQLLFPILQNLSKYRDILPDGSVGNSIYNQKLVTLARTNTGHQEISCGGRSSSCADLSVRIRINAENEITQDSDFVSVQSFEMWNTAILTSILNEGTEKIRVSGVYFSRNYGEGVFATSWANSGTIEVSCPYDTISRNYWSSRDFLRNKYGSSTSIRWYNNIYANGEYIHGSDYHIDAIKALWTNSGIFVAKGPTSLDYIHVATNTHSIETEISNGAFVLAGAISPNMTGVMQESDFITGSTITHTSTDANQISNSGLILIENGGTFVFTYPDIIKAVTNTGYIDINSGGVFALTPNTTIANVPNIQDMLSLDSLSYIHNISPSSSAYLDLSSVASYKFLTGGINRTGQLSVFTNSNDVMGKKILNTTDMSGSSVSTLYVRGLLNPVAATDVSTYITGDDFFAFDTDSELNASTVALKILPYISLQLTGTGNLATSFFSTDEYVSGTTLPVADTHAVITKPYVGDITLTGNNAWFNGIVTILGGTLTATETNSMFAGETHIASGGGLNLSSAAIKANHQPIIRLQGGALGILGNCVLKTLDVTATSTLNSQDASTKTITTTDFTSSFALNWSLNLNPGIGNDKFSPTNAEQTADIILTNLNFLTAPTADQYTFSLSDNSSLSFSLSPSLILSSNVDSANYNFSIDGTTLIMERIGIYFDFDNQLPITTVSSLSLWIDSARNTNHLDVFTNFVGASGTLIKKIGEDDVRLTGDNSGFLGTFGIQEGSVTASGPNSLPHDILVRTGTDLTIETGTTSPGNTAEITLNGGTLVTKGTTHLGGVTLAADSTLDTRDSTIASVNFTTGLELNSHTLRWLLNVSPSGPDTLVGTVSNGNVLISDIVPVGDLTASRYSFSFCSTLMNASVTLIPEYTTLRSGYCTYGLSMLNNALTMIKIIQHHNFDDATSDDIIVYKDILYLIDSDTAKTISRRFISQVDSAADLVFVNVEKRGSGSLTLTGDNSFYLGNFKLIEGALVIEGVHSLSAGQNFAFPGTTILF